MNMKKLFRSDAKSAARDMFQVLETIGLLLLTAGCMTVGPDYHAPQTRMPTNWTDNGTAAFAPPSLTNPQLMAITNWWATFKDEKLATLVARAIATNLDLRMAESRVRQARAQRGVAVAGFWPSLNANGSYTRQGGGNNQNALDGDFYQAGLDATWELDIFGGTRRNVEAANADVAASIEDRRAVLVTLISEVALNYISLRGYQQQIVIAKENLVAQEHSAEYARKRFSGGFNSKLDVVNAEAQMATTRAQIPVLETAARQTVYALSLLLALEPSALVTELANDAPIPLTPPEVPVGLPSDLLRRRPDIRQAEAQLHGATARIGVAVADLFPQFALTGALGIEGQPPSSLVNWNNRFYSLGPSVNWNVFDFGRIRSNIKVQNELEEQALLGYQKTVLTALNDVESALVAYVREQQHRQALAEAVADNTQAVQLATQLYTEGQTDFLNVLVAQRSLYTAQDALVQSERTVATDLVASYKAWGGGWENEPPASS
jgi:NodT family efflux transporter outer membrane factor (OMF) lipoprotein